MKDMLVKDLYSIEQTSPIEGGALFSVSILPGCEVYEGHFPLEPVTPGVCSVQMIKECAESILGYKTRLSEIKTCRFYSPITPFVLPKAQIKLLQDGRNISATVSDPEGVEYMSLKATLERE